MNPHPGFARLSSWPDCRSAPGRLCRNGIREAIPFLTPALRRIGRVIGQNDMIIAAIARITGNGMMVTMDSDVGAVRGPCRGCVKRD